MSNAIPKIPAAAPAPAKAYPKPPVAPPPAALPVLDHHHAATATSPAALSNADVSYVDSLMGVLPAQRMEEILLKTGVPIPAHLGPNVDTSA